MMFVLSAGMTALNDFVSLSGAKLAARVIVIVLAAVLVGGFAAGSAPLSWVRGVRRRQSLTPRVFGFLVFAGGLGAWLIVRYGYGLAQGLAGAVGMGDYPYTVTGVLYGAAFAALFAVEQLLITTAQRRTLG